MCSLKVLTSPKSLTTFAVVLGIVLVIGCVRLFSGPASVPAKKPVASGRTFGVADARLRVIEFTDFQCPACAGAARRLHEEMVKDGASIFLELRHFPWPKHSHARKAAATAECAMEQGKFWPMHDMLFESQKRWEALSDPSDHFLGLARGLGLDEEKMMRCMVSAEVDARITADVAEGKKLGVAATPTFFLNGRMVVGAANLQYAIREALK